jgi:hypothetical protein
MCVYSIIRWQDRQLPTPELQAIFNEGNHQESAIKLDLLKAGIEINESQTEVSFPEYRLFGHIDGSYAKGKKTWAVEFKSISEHLFKVMNTADDFINSKFPHHRCYIPQIQLYMFGRKLKSGLLILKNKNSGWLKEIEVKLDKTLCQFYLDKCTRINKCVDESKIILHETYQIKEIADFDKKKDREDYQEIKNGACKLVEQCLPERITDNCVCSMCNFSNICLPSEIREERAKVWINEHL